MNSIGTIALQVKARNEDFVRQWYSQFDHFTETRIAPIAERVLMRCEEYGYTFEINKLELDLGSIPEDRFQEDFERLFEEQLEEQLLRAIHHPSTKKDKRTDDAVFLLEALKQFLLHGTFNWSLAQRFGDISTLFRQVLQSHARELRDFLLTYGHYTSLQHRLVYQLDEEQLFQGVELLAPAEINFIRSYITYLRLKYRTIQTAPIREEERIQSVWKVIYAYLLHSGSTTFNRKLFVRKTIGSLAAHLNIHYTELLQVLTELPEETVTVPTGLQVILSELKQEEQLRNRMRQVQTPEEWAGLLRELRQSNNRIVLSDPEIRHLLQLLEREERVLQVIRPMQETEIYELVKLIAPTDAGFVIEYAKHLDRQQQKGALQGQASGAFRLFKWQIILPVLAIAKRAPINRNYLIWHVFKRLSNHYNIRLYELLSFAYLEIQNLQLGQELKTLIQELLESEKRTSSEGKENAELHFDRQLQLIRGKKAFTSGQLETLHTLMQRERQRELLLDLLSEEERHYLLRLLRPEEATILSAFLGVIDYSQEIIRTEYTTGTVMERLKWTFLFQVLHQFKNQVFNRVSVVRSILEKTGAHYNLRLQELVEYFYTRLNERFFSVPFNLYNILISIRKQLINSSSVPAVTDGDTMSDKEQNWKRYFTENEQKMPIFRSLLAQPEQLRYFLPLWEATEQLVTLIQRNWQVHIDRSALLRLFQRYFHGPKISDANRRNLLSAVIQLIRQRLTPAQEKSLLQVLQTTTNLHPLLHALTENLKPETKDETTEETEMEELDLPEEDSDEIIYIHNAGLVLLAPYIPRLFEMLDLLENGTFKNRDAQIKGIFALQYAAFGAGEFPEYELRLNKLLTGFQTGKPLPRSVELSTEEQELIHSLLEAIIQTWDKLGNTKMQGLRGFFLQREAKLTEEEEQFILTVENKGYDVLLDFIPWSFRVIKHRWMKKGIQVKWR